MVNFILFIQTWWLYLSVNKPKLSWAILIGEGFWPVVSCFGWMSFQCVFWHQLWSESHWNECVHPSVDCSVIHACLCPLLRRSCLTAPVTGGQGSTCTCQALSYWHVMSCPRPNVRSALRWHCYVLWWTTSITTGSVWDTILFVTMSLESPLAL